MSESRPRQSGFRIRRARAGDLDALVALEEAVFDYDRMSRRQYRHHLASTKALVMVASDGRILLGCGLVFLRRGSRLARLYSLASAPAARGRGVGARLLTALLRAARANGCTRMRLEVRTDNAAAIGLYERRGFRRIAHLRHYYDNGEDAFRYEANLTTRSP